MLVVGEFAVDVIKCLCAHRLQEKEEDDLVKWPNCNSKWTEKEGASLNPAGAGRERAERMARGVCTRRQPQYHPASHIQRD